MTGAVATYESWVAEYDRAYAEPASIGSQVCPRCGHHALRLVFVLDSRGSGKGRPYFWCDNCSHGIFFSRVGVPPGAERITEEQEHEDHPIPDYRIVMPD